MEIKLTNGFLFRKWLLMIIMRTFIFLFFTTALALTPNEIVSQNSKYALALHVRKEKLPRVNTH